MSIHRATLMRRRPVRPGRHLSAARPGGRHLGPGRPMSASLASDRGDVPGWVMITLMTAAIVVALWAVASDQIVQIFESAMQPFLQGV